MMDTKQLIEELNKRTIVVDDGPDGRGGYHSHLEFDPVCQEAARRLDLAERLIANMSDHDGAEGFSASTYRLLDEWYGNES